MPRVVLNQNPRKVVASMASLYERGIRGADQVDLLPSSECEPMKFQILTTLRWAERTRDPTQICAISTESATHFAIPQ